MTRAGDDLSNVRGMGEPLFFSFSVLPKSKSLLCHAVIFSSFQVAGEDTVIHLATPEDDPRFPTFIDFAVENYGKKAKDALAKEIKRLANELNDLEIKLAQLRKMIKETKATS